MFVFLVSCDCCVALPGGAMGLSAVCDCGISGYTHYFDPDQTISNLIWVHTV